MNFQSETYYWPADDDTALVLHKREMLPAITAECVGAGVTKSGRVLFQFAGNISNELIWNAATLHIGCADRKQKTTWQSMGQMYPANEITVFPHEALIRIDQLDIEAPKG